MWSTTCRPSASTVRATVLSPCRKDMACPGCVTPVSGENRTSEQVENALIPEAVQLGAIGKPLKNQRDTHVDHRRFGAMIGSELVHGGDTLRVFGQLDRGVKPKRGSGRSVMPLKASISASLVANGKGNADYDAETAND